MANIKAKTKPIILTGPPATAREAAKKLHVTSHQFQSISKLISNLKIGQSVEIGVKGVASTKNRLSKISLQTSKTIAALNRAEPQRSTNRIAKKATKKASKR